MKIRRVAAVVAVVAALSAPIAVDSSAEMPRGRAWARGIDPIERVIRIVKRIFTPGTAEDKLSPPKP